MANTPIKIKRSLVTSAPVVLNIGEPAYSYASNTLFIGTPDSNAAIAAKMTDALDVKKVEIASNLLGTEETNELETTEVEVDGAESSDAESTDVDGSDEN